MTAHAALAYEVHHLIAPLFWSIFVSVVLVGCSVSQAFAWVRHSAKNDSFSIRAFVGVSVCMSIAKCVCDLMGLHFILASAGRTVAQIPLAFRIGEALSATLVVLSQSWQFHRTLIIARYHRAIVWLGGVMLLVSIAATVLFIVGFSRSGTIAQTTAMVHIWNPFSSWIKVALDLFLSGSFTVIVLRAERRAIDHSLRHKLRRIAVTALEAFVPCSLLATGRAIAGYAAPHSTLFAGMLVVLAPLYVVSILHTLNSREAIKRQAGSIGFGTEQEVPSGLPR